MHRKQCVTPTHTHTAPQRAGKTAETTPFCICPPGRTNPPLWFIGSWLLFLPLLGPWHPSHGAFRCLGANGPERLSIGCYVFIISKRRGTQPLGPASGLEFLQKHDPGNRWDEKELMSWVRGAGGSVGGGRMLNSYTIHLLQLTK